MNNLFISNLNEKDVQHFTSNTGMLLRRRFDKPFKKLCNVFTGTNIIRCDNGKNLSNEEYFDGLSHDYIDSSTYNIEEGKNNIILERYPELDDDSYIFVCNHTCPEDIETVLNIIDRNAYLILGSIESLKTNPEMYLSFINGMIPFDIMDNEERKELPAKMERVLNNKNSILIFPEGSHNYHPNKIINNLFDGPVNLAEKTGKKIVVISMIKDQDKNISYIDVSNPIDFANLSVNVHDFYPRYDEKISEELKMKERDFSENYELSFDKEKEINNLEKKYKIKSKSLLLRDYMATAAYNLFERHIPRVVRSEYEDIEKHFTDINVTDAFKKLKWDKDIFEAEYLVKKTDEEKDYEEAIHTLSNLRLNMDSIRNNLGNREYVLKRIDLENKDTANNMRKHLSYIKKK